MLFELLGQSPQMFLIVVMAVIYALTVHEFSHALAANYLGDSTARYSGRLSLNPMVHLDIWGTLMLLIAGFGWGKPVPVNVYNLRWKKWGDAAVSLAGPLSNFISVAIFIFIFKMVAPYLAPDNLLAIFLAFLVLVNLILGVFNLIPIPPLDGSKILFAALPEKFDSFKKWMNIYGMWVLLGLLIVDNFTHINIFGRIFQFFIDIINKV